MAQEKLEHVPSKIALKATSSRVHTFSCDGTDRSRRCRAVLRRHRGHPRASLEKCCPPIAPDAKAEFSACARHTHHLSPTREINAGRAQCKLATGLWAPEYLLMYLLGKCVPAGRLGSYSSVTARRGVDAVWRTNLFPL